MNIFPLRKEMQADTEKTKLIKALFQAQREYNIARSYFSEATEPEIVDQAIFLMEAAKKKYGYFLKRIRNESAF